MFSNTRTIELMLLSSYARYVLQYSVGGLVDKRPRFVEFWKNKLLITRAPVLI